MNCEELSRLDARSLAIFAGNLFDEQLCRRVGFGPNAQLNNPRLEAEGF